MPLARRMIREFRQIQGHTVAVRLFWGGRPATLSWRNRYVILARSSPDAPHPLRYLGAYFDEMAQKFHSIKTKVRTRLHQTPWRLGVAPPKTLAQQPTFRHTSSKMHGSFGVMPSRKPHLTLCGETVHSTRCGWAFVAVHRICVVADTQSTALAVISEPTRTWRLQARLILQLHLPKLSGARPEKSGRTPGVQTSLGWRKASNCGPLLASATVVLSAKERPHASSNHSSSQHRRV